MPRVLPTTSDDGLVSSATAFGGALRAGEGLRDIALSFRYVLAL